MQQEQNEQERNKQRQADIQRVIDEQYMRMAIELAKKGCGWVSPNPMVGAVVVKNEQVIGQGYHMKYGELHAERNALASCVEDTIGATIYVTLEPCCHYGKTPPCTEAIIERGIKRVVVGSDDPNPLVGGKGFEILRNHGIEVVTHVLKDECDAMNEVFFHYIRTKSPLIIMKYAQTLDGKIATYTGASQWITGEQAREHVHEDRHRYMAIMTGVGTVIADDPMLTCRAKNVENTKNPIRIICDSHLNTPLDSKIVQTAKEIRTIIATIGEDEEVKNIDNPDNTINGSRQEKEQLYKEQGCEILHVNEKNGHLDLNDLKVQLGKLKIDSVYMEGGQTLNWSALEAGIVNKVHAYIAPKIFGGTKALTPVGGTGVDVPDHAINVVNQKLIQLGDDYLITGDVEVDVCLQES